MPALLPAFINRIPLRALASSSWLSRAVREISGDRVLVLIQLNGGNDGLNTVIPLEFYDAYYKSPDQYRHSRRQSAAFAGSGRDEGFTLS